MKRFSCNSKINVTLGGHFSYLLRTALFQLQIDLRMLVQKRRDRIWQHVTSLSVGCGERKTPRNIVRVVRCHPPDRLGLAQNFAREVYDCLTCGRDMGQMLAATREYLNAQLTLEQTDLLTDAGLRGKKALGCR